MFRISAGARHPWHPCQLKPCYVLSYCIVLLYCSVALFRCNFFMPIIKIIKQFCHYATWYTLSIPAQPLKLKAFSILFFLHCTYFVKITHKNYYLQTQHQGRNRGLRPYDCGLTFILQNRTRRWQQRHNVMVILACPDARAALMAP